MITRLLTRNTERASRPEGGFTLLEMVIAVILLVLITGAISAALVSSLNATSATKTRVNETNDAQLIAGFFTRDAQAAGGTNPATGSPDTSAPPAGHQLGVTAPANNGCSAPAGTSIIGFKWIDLSTSTTYESNYSYVPTTTTVNGVTYQPQQFLRTVCTTPPAAPPITSTATSVLANNVVTTATATLSTPVAWCDNNPPATPCPSPPSPPAPQPNTVLMPNTVHMTISDYQNSASNVTTPDTFTLTASLRPQSTASPDPASSTNTASLVLLSGSGNCLSTQDQAFRFTLYGSALLGGCSTNISKLIPFGPVFANDCTDWPAGTCTPDSTPATDPFQARIDAGLLTAPAVDCSPSPGLRPPTPTGTPLHWQPGTYPQDPQAGGTEHPFDPGIYVFCNGLSGNVIANLQGGPIGGTFLYFAGGTYNCEPPPGSSPSCSTTVQLTPPRSGQYDGLAIWQAKKPQPDTTTMSFSKGLVNITGTVYAPSATINMKNGNININQLIAYAIIGNPGNPNVHIGPPLRATLPVDLNNYLPPATIGQPYSAQAIAVEGTGVYSNWSIVSGPAWLTIDPATGVLTGTPPNGSQGTYSPVIVRVHDNDNESDNSDPASITVNPALIISGSLPSAWVLNQPGFGSSSTLAASGGSGGYQWSWTGQPTGLSMGTDGTISGNPTATGTFTPTVKVIDSIGDVTTRNNFTINITATAPATKLVLSAATTTPAAGAADNLTITAQDAAGNTDTGYTGNKTLNFSGAATIGTFSPTVTNSTGTATNFGTAETITFVNGVAQVSGSNNGQMVLYKAGTSSIVVSDGSISNGSGLSVTVTSASASVMTLTNCVVQGAAQACNGTYHLGNAGNMTAKVTVTDAYGNVPPNTTVTMTVTSGDITKYTVSGSPISITNGTVSTTLTVNKLGNGSNTTAITIHATAGPYADLVFSPMK